MDEEKMPKFPKYIREEIKNKYALTDEKGNKVYLQKELAEEYHTSRRNIVAFSKGFNTITEYYENLAMNNGYESYADYRNKIYLIKNKNLEIRIKK